MTITVDTPDGGRAEFPDGTSTDTISAAMRAKFGGPTTNDVAGSTVQRALSTGTLGLTDIAGAGVNAIARATGYDPNAPTLEQIRQQNEQFGQEHPYLATGADIAGYGVGFGKLGIGARLAKGAEALGAGAKTAQALGTAGEAGAATAGSDILSGQTPGSDVLANATIGGGLGALIGGRGRALGPAVSRASSEAAATPGGAIAKLRAAAEDITSPENKPPRPIGEDVLEANKNAAYDRLKTIPVNPMVVDRAIDSAVNSLSPGELSGLTPGFASQIQRVRDVNRVMGNQINLDSVDSFQRNIGAAANSGPDSIAAARIGENLRAIYAKPQADARMAQARLSDIQWLGKNPTPEGAAARVNNPQFLYDAPGRAAMQALADAGPSKFKEMAQNLAAVGINTAGAGAIGHTLGGLFGEGGLGGLAGVAVGRTPGGVGGMIARYPSNAAIKRAVKAAKAAISTGQPVTADQYLRVPWLEQAARQVLYAKSAAGP